VLQQLPLDASEAGTLQLLIGLSAHLDGQIDVAEKSLAAALRLLQRAPGDHGAAIGDVLNALAAIRFERRDNEQSLAYVEDAIRYYEAAGVGLTPAVASTLTNKACLFVRMKRLADADILFARALEILRSRLGPTHQMVGQMMMAYSGVLEEVGKGGRAKAHRKRAENILALHNDSSPAAQVVDLVDLIRENSDIE
jgi:tetratricopeptide (TPR) repeat protein